MNDQRPHTAEAALETIGLSLEKVLEVGGSAFTAGKPYLVGSLASGFGNRTSDVDIHVFIPGIDKPSMPYLFFAGRTPVDLECFPESAPRDVEDRVRDAMLVQWPVGDIASVAIESKSRKATSRWLSARPLRANDPELFDQRMLPKIRGALSRSIVDKLVSLWAIARLASAAVRQDGSGWHDSRAAYLWTQTGRALLELLCSARGQVTTNDKWLSSRAAKLGVPAAQIEACYAAATEQDMLPLLAEIGVRDWDPLRLTEIKPDPDAQIVKFSEVDHLVSRHERLLTTWLVDAGSTADVVERHSPARLLDAIRRAEVRLVVDCDRLWGELTDV